MLAVFGDSFAEGSEVAVYPVTRVSWLEELARNLGVELDNHGYPGTSLWYSYTKFLENYKDKTHIVFVYTEHNRWHCLPDELKRLSSVYSQRKLDTFPTIVPGTYEHDVMQQLVKAHRYIFDEQFNIFVYQQIFNIVNQICRDNNIKLVNIFPFNDNEPEIETTNTYGSCITGLGTISINELGEYIGNETVRFYDDRLEFFYKGRGDYRANHLNSPNNQLLAKVIQEEFDNDNPKVIELLNDDRLVYDAQILLDYMTELQAVIGND